MTEGSQRSCCRFVCCIIAAAILFIEQIVMFTYALMNNKGFLGFVAVLTFLIVAFTCFAVFGNYNMWKCLKTPTLVILFIITFIFVIALTATITTWTTYSNELPLHNSAEIKLKDETVSLCLIYCIVIVIEFLVCVVLYVPLQFLYSDAISFSKIREDLSGLAPEIATKA